MPPSQKTLTMVAKLTVQPELDQAAMAQVAREMQAVAGRAVRTKVVVPFQVRTPSAIDDEGAVQYSGAMTASAPSEREAHARRSAVTAAIARVRSQAARFTGYVAGVTGVNKLLARADARAAGGDFEGARDLMNRAKAGVYDMGGYVDMPFQRRVASAYARGSVDELYPRDRPSSWQDILKEAEAERARGLNLKGRERVESDARANALLERSNLEQRRRTVSDEKALLDGYVTRRGVLNAARGLAQGGVNALVGYINDPRSPGMAGITMMGAAGGSASTLGSALVTAGKVGAGAVFSTVGSVLGGLSDIFGALYSRGTKNRDDAVRLQRSFGAVVGAAGGGIELQDITAGVAGQGALRDAAALSSKLKKGGGLMFGGLIDKMTVGPVAAKFGSNQFEGAMVLRHQGERAALARRLAHMTGMDVSDIPKGIAEYLSGTGMTLQHMMRGVGPRPGGMRADTSYLATFGEPMQLARQLGVGFETVGAMHGAMVRSGAGVLASVDMLRQTGGAAQRAGMSDYAIKDLMDTMATSMHKDELRGLSTLGYPALANQALNGGVSNARLGNVLGAYSSDRTGAFDAMFGWTKDLGQIAALTSVAKRGGSIQDIGNAIRAMSAEQYQGALGSLPAGLGSMYLQGRGLLQTEAAGYLSASGAGAAYHDSLLGVAESRPGAVGGANTFARSAVGLGAIEKMEAAAQKMNEAAAALRELFD